MLTIFRQTLRDRRSALLIYCISGILLLWMYVAIFPSIQAQAQSVAAIWDKMPKGMMKAFGVESFDLSDLGNFLSTEQFSFVWPIVMLIMMIAFAASNLAGEVERGSMEILLSQPITRLRLFFSRYLAGITTLLVFCFTSIGALYPLVHLYGLTLTNAKMTNMVVIGFLFGWAVLSLAFLFSALLSEKGKVYFTTSGILVAMYVINIVSGLKDSFENLKYCSFFYYYSPTQALVHQNIYPSAYWVFGGCAIVFTLIAAVIFNRRDVAV